MKKVIFAFSAVAVVFMMGKSEAVMPDKAMHKVEMHEAKGMLKNAKHYNKFTKEQRDHAATLFKISKDRIAMHEARTDDQMSTKRNEYFKKKIKMKKKPLKKAKSPKMMGDNAVLFSLGGMVDKAKDTVKSGVKKVKDLGKKVKPAAVSAMQIAAQHGPVAMDLVKKHGPKVMDLVKKHGPDAVVWMHEHGPKVAKDMVERHGDRLVGAAMDHGPKVMSAVKKYGPAALDLMGKGGKVALDMMAK